MQSTSILCVLLAGLMAFSSCAPTLQINASLDQNQNNTGSLVLQPTRNLQRAYVTLDNKMVVEKKRFKNVVINNLTPGTHEVSCHTYQSGLKSALAQKNTVNVKANEQSTVVVDVPPMSDGAWIYSGIILGTLWAAFIFGTENDDH